MNLRDVEYIVRIADEGNISRAAEKLYITPSALTQQLTHLEKEIGTPLFFRARGGCTPTEAGEIYLKTAREMLRMRRETYNRLQDIVSAKKGSFSIGFPPERGVSMFTSVYPAFHREYPDITINVHEVNVRSQQQMIANGDLDIGFLTLCEKHQTDDEYILIKEEELLLAVPSGHPICQEITAGQTSGSPYPEIQLSALRYEPFAQMYKASTMREITDDIFRQESFRPTVLFETSRPHTLLDMVAARLCCAIISSYYASTSTPGIAFFSLPSHPVWRLVASYRKGTYLNQAARYFIQLACDYWN